MTEKELEFKGLETDLAALRDIAPAPSAALLARVMADAEAVRLDLGAPVPQAAAPARRRGIVASLAEALGGWPAMAGLTAAAVTGIWLGASPPEMLRLAAGDLLAYGPEGDGWLVLSPDPAFDFGDDP